MSSSPALTIITRVPLPAYLDPQTVLDTLQTYEPLIMASPHAKKYERRQIQVEELVDDPFFLENGHKIQAFVVHDRVPIIPGVGSWATKGVRVPCVFQSFEHGVRCRADSEAGVTVRSCYEVRRRGEIQGGSIVERRPGDGDYELVETASIDCGAFVKAFVKRTFTSAHQATLQHVVDETVRKHGHVQQQEQQQQYRPQVA
ncbi:hypothetical protein B0H66DRAFT_221954 [Apodospora peruviana]|uniref:DUF7053 domain-containing protein n=1 Tax=Apodospora peruviana TaxID=516989 RepID=A0AAE0M3N7_9PEZI|nr:hypothetical protein B0H66DRAFT_221954 [Apodospora peruviana]